MNRMTLAIITILLLLIMLNACGEGNKQTTKPLVQGQNDQQAPTPSSHSIPIVHEEELQLSSTVSEGDFQLTIFTEKTQYAANGPINVYAELVYVGEREQIEIGHSMYPIGFDISEHTRSYFTMGAMNEPYHVTTLKQNEPIRFDYSFSGGYSSDDDQQYIDFINALVDKKFPTGKYTITAHASFNEHISTEQQQKNEQESNNSATQSSTNYGFSASISFIVGNGN